ncbi:AAA family ATPase [Lysinibacillus tabacifolii]|uniref:AAA family ATPase n=1 Tax=Lysinibacillus tabacifolii TaxID=1173107 RepID=UPI00187D5846|nr:AAA family ATPase [Lysinibacillus tabacifolii]
MNFNSNEIKHEYKKWKKVHLLKKGLSNLFLASKDFLKTELYKYSFSKDKNDLYIDFIDLTKEIDEVKKNEDLNSFIDMHFDSDYEFDSFIEVKDNYLNDKDDEVKKNEDLNNFIDMHFDSDYEFDSFIKDNYLNDEYDKVKKIEDLNNFIDMHFNSDYEFDSFIEDKDNNLNDKYYEYDDYDEEYLDIEFFPDESSGFNKENLPVFLYDIVETKIKNINNKIDLATKVINEINFFEKNIDLENKALLNFFTTYPNEKIFKYNWRNLSSGEVSFISFLSRLYKASTMVEKNEDIILIIDEGELYFHPQWQKNYLNILIETLNQLFKKNKMQIILTSHSPFIVSDLPDYAIQILSDEKISDVVKELNLHRTFAANIQELYTNAFFLKGGLTGEFAKSKVNEWIRQIYESPQEANKEYNFYYNAFNIIGEPLVREKCLSLLEQKNEEYLNSKSFHKKNNHELLEYYKKMVERIEGEINEKN